jgi:hypothetical protein
MVQLRTKANRWARKYIQPSLLVLGAALIGGLSACAKQAPSSSQVAPTINTILPIERYLQAQPCAAPLQQWSRHYRYATRGDEGVDRSVILFDYREAGRFGYKQGIFLDPPQRGWHVDERHYKVAFGRYEPATGQIVMGYCGSN